VGRKTFALVNGDGRAILKLERGHQELLFEIRPQAFARCPVATAYWSYVELAHVDADELAMLVREAWSQVAPKEVSRPYLASFG